MTKATGCTGAAPALPSWAPRWAGGAVNPARALGPMIVNWDFTSVWLYILGPIIGGVLAAFVYQKTMAEE